MKVLIVHNCYGGLSGEEVVVRLHKKALEDIGCEVKLWMIGSERTPASFIAKVLAFFSCLYNPISQIRIWRYFKEFNPDVVHFHNIYPWISASAVMECRRQRKPYFFTAHNYRSICPSATLYFNGKDFLDGARGKAISVVTNNLFEDYFISVGYYLRFKVNRLLNIEERAEALVCVSRHVKDKIDLFSNCRNTVVVENPFYGECVCIDDLRRAGSAATIGYLGRISEEKGWSVLLATSKIMTDRKFLVAGSVSGKIDLSDVPENMEFTGYLDRDRVASFFHQIDVLVIPSIWHEPFGMVVLEALSFGTPVIASSKGALNELVGFFEGCYTYDSTVEGLVHSLETWSGDQFYEAYSVNIDRLKRRFGLDRYGRELMSVYEKGKQLE